MGRVIGLSLVLGLCCTLSLASSRADDAAPTAAPPAKADTPPKDQPAKADGEKKPEADKKPDGDKKPDPDKKNDGEKRLDARAMIRKLQARTDVRADKTPLTQVVAQLSKQHDVVIRIDEAALKKAGVALDVPLTATIKNLTLNAALGQLLKELKLRHVARDGVIVITADVEVQDLQQVGKAHIERKADEVREREERAAVAQKVAANLVPAGAPIDPEQAAAEIAALEKQFTRQFRGALTLELNFVRKVCEPTDEQVSEITEVVEKYRTDIVNKYADAHKRAARGGRQVAGNPFPGDPRDMVRRSLARTVKSSLDPEQVARYEQEVGQRGTDRKRAGVQTLVARLDHDLNLSGEQRDKLADSFTTNWTNTWSEQFDVFLRQPGSQFLPNIPERLIAPFLSGTQKKIWRASKENNQANQGINFFPGGFIGGGIAIEALVDDGEAAVEVEVQPAPRAAPARVKKAAEDK